MISWMAWTWQSAAFFAGIFALIGAFTLWEIRRPGGAPRDGVLGLTTTRGDRLFITLLGSGWIFLGWLGLMGTPLWGGLGLALAWAFFVFRWV